MERRASALALIIAAVVLAGLAAGLSRLALARLVRYDLGASPAVVAGLTSWFMAPRAFSAVATGALADRLGAARAWRLLIGPPMLLVALVVYATSHAGSVAGVMLLNAAWGLLSGMAWPATQVAVAVLARGRSATALSVYFAAASLGMSIGQGLYALTPGNRWALRLAAAMFAAAGLLLLPAARRAAPEAPPGRSRAGLLAALRASLAAGAGLFLLAAFASGYSTALLRELLYIYLGEEVGLTREGLSAFLLAAGVLSFLAGLAAGPLADRRGAARVLAWALAAGAAGNAMLAVPEAAPVFAGLVLAQASGRASLPLTRNAAALGLAAGGTLVGAANAASNLGQVVSPLLGGLLYDVWPGLPFLSSAAVLAAASAALARRSGR